MAFFSFRQITYVTFTARKALKGPQINQGRLTDWQRQKTVQTCTDNSVEKEILQEKPPYAFLESSLK